MAKKPSATKEELLQGVIEYLAENGIAHASFRSIAAKLGISHYPLVYYFGSKEQLLSAVVAEVEKRQREYVERGLHGSGSLVYWHWCVENPELLRLDMEILLHEGRHSADCTLANLVFRDWHRLWVERFMSAGLTREAAEIEATLSVAIGVGLQVDLLATGDVERTTRAFRARHNTFMRELAGDSSAPAPPEPSPPTGAGGGRPGPRA